MWYPVTAHWLMKKSYPSCIWDMDTKDPAIYLTFDDGPHPSITPWVLDTLQSYQAKATFFCIGKNVEAYPEVYKKILEAGHVTGNHTQNHLNGWKTADTLYFENIQTAKKNIDSLLFRPPYGAITGTQIKKMKKADDWKIIMWSVLSGDFDISSTPQQCWNNIKKNTKAGSIVVMHDSEKAKPRLEYALKNCLDYFSEKGYQFKSL